MAFDWRKVFYQDGKKLGVCVLRRGIGLGLSTVLGYFVKVEKKK
jgi:hypothetical protein